nr:hypothetical protein [Tanacetum cinerariifolium]
MSSSAYVDSETITQANGAQISRVPVLLPNDPYVAVRQAQLLNTDTESDPEEAPSEAEESQLLGSRVPLMSKEFEALEPSAQIAEAAALSLSSFCKRYRSSYETSSSSSPTLPVRKRYRGEGDEAVPEAQQQAVSGADTAVGKPLGLGYEALIRRELAVEENRLLSTFKVAWDALPPTLFADIGRDVREMYTRPVLALEAWAGQTDAQRAALWHAIYDIQRENHDLRMQLTEERRERLELVDRVARIEKRQESKEE